MLIEVLFNVLDVLHSRQEQLILIIGSVSEECVKESKVRHQTSEFKVVRSLLYGCVDSGKYLHIIVAVSAGSLTATGPLSIRVPSLCHDRPRAINDVRQLYNSKFRKAR